MAAAMALVASQAHAWQTRVLDASACVAPLPPAPAPLFADGFDEATASWSRPSGGSGGAYPGNLTRSVYVPEVGAYRTYNVRIPPQYDPARAWPVVVGLHGAGGAGTAPAAANAVRATWAPLADASGFIVVAPIASGVGVSYALARLLPEPGSNVTRWSEVVAVVLIGLMAMRLTSFVTH
ncbi:MAG TPA: hypothetical protein VFL14_00450, partial [Xanthomonadales bacterium]|nr:hypothetical protein [Xanthomonadales bacterium]